MIDSNEGVLCLGFSIIVQNHEMIFF